jgi:hypothetical protein
MQDILHGSQLATIGKKEETTKFQCVSLLGL